MEMSIRPRRLRSCDNLRRMVRETRVSPDSLVYPLFLIEGENIKEPIPSLDGQYRYSPDRICEEIGQCLAHGVSRVLLFGIPAHKDAIGSSAWDPNGVVQQGIRAIKEKYPQMYVITDMIKICILAYTGITVFAVFLRSQWQFWLLAVLVGMFQGGIQALSRSYLGKIIPAERSGEYFGLMDICGKGASFLGTTLIAVISQATAGMTIRVFGQEIQNESLAVGTLVLLFALGFVVFCKADKLNRQRR